MIRYDIISNYNNSLSTLSNKYKSDKGALKENYEKLGPWGWKPHTYSEIYDLLFKLNRHKVLNFFEVGIGTNNTDVKSSMGPNGSPGASLRMWRDYFPNAQIYGADIDERILFEEERIKTFHVDQTSKKSIKEMWSNIPNKMDVILDDGLHELEANMLFLENSFDSLSDNGIYIIEDCSYYYKELSDCLTEKKYNHILFQDPENFDSQWGYLNSFIIINKADQ